MSIPDEGGTTGADPGVVPDEGPTLDPDVGDNGPIAPPVETAWSVVELGTHRTIRAVWGPGDGTFYAAGDHGTLLWFNGQTWTPLPHLTDADLFGVGGRPGGDVFVVGAGGTVLRRDHAGWNVLDSGVDVDLHGIHADIDAVRIVGDAGTILRFEPNGFEAEVSNTGADLRAVFTAPGGVPMAAGSGGQIHRFAGGQWVSTQAASSAVTLTGLWGTSAQFVVAVGTGGTILVSTGSTQWSAQTSNDIDERDLYGVWGTSAEEVFVVGDDGVIIGFNGSKWTVVETAGPLYTTTPMRGVWGVTAGDVRRAFAVGADGAILAFDSEEDASWRDTDSGPDLTIADVTWVDDASPEGSFVACGGAGLVLRWLGLRGWTGISSGLDHNLLAVHPWGEPGNVLVVGQNGVAANVSPTDRITAVDLATTRTMRAVGGGGDRPLVVVGDAGTIRVRDGDAFVSEPSGTVARLIGVYVEPDGAWAVGDSGTILSRASDGTWDEETAPTSSGLNAVVGDGERVYALGDNGVIVARGADGSWSREHESPEDFLYGAAVVGDEILAVGWTGMVLRRSPDGWVEEVSGTKNVLEAVAAAPGGPIWTVGRQGTLLRRR